MSVVIYLRYGFGSGVSEELIGEICNTLVVDENDLFGLLASFGDAMSQKLDVSYHFDDVV